MRIIVTFPLEDTLDMIRDRAGVGSESRRCPVSRRASAHAERTERHEGFDPGWIQGLWGKHMKAGLLGAFATLFLNAVWAVAQTPAPSGVVMPSTVGMQPSSVGAPLIGGESADGGGPIWYGNAEYVLFKIKNGTLPSTATTLPVGLISVDITNSSTRNRTIPGTPDANPITGYAPVSIASNSTFGAGSRTDTGYSNGGRFDFGFWADSDMSYGLQAGFLFLAPTTDHFASLSGQSPGQFILDTGFTKTLFLVTPAVPPATTPTTSPLSTTQVFVTRQASSSLSGVASNQLYGGELNARGVFVRIGGTDIGGLAGFRALAFKDELSLTNNVTLTQPPGIPPTSTDASATLSNNLTFSSRDHTRVWNYFYGGQVGMDIDSKFGSFFVNACGKVAFGGTHQVVDINSSTMIVNNDPMRLSPPSSSTAGGLLAGPNDNGRHTREVVSIIPEVDVKVGYQFTDWLRGYVGYSGIYLNNVARAGDNNAVNTQNTTVTVASTPINVNVSQPTFRFRNQDVTVQGITFGFEAKY